MTYNYKDYTAVDYTQTGEDQQVLNAKKRKKGLPMGVSRYGKKFRADIMADGERFYLGTFHSPELAGFAYAQAKEIHHVIPSRVL